MLIAGALGLSLMLLSIPSALLVGVSLLIQGALDIPWSAWELPMWGLLAAIPYAGGAYLIVVFGAQLWKAMDPSKEILEIGR